MTAAEAVDWVAFKIVVMMMLRSLVTSCGLFAAKYVPVPPAIAIAVSVAAAVGLAAGLTPAPKPMMYVSTPAVLAAVNWLMTSVSA